jgi:hypothetical protein
MQIDDLVDWRQNYRHQRRVVLSGLIADLHIRSCRPPTLASNGSSWSRPSRLSKATRSAV